MKKNKIFSIIFLNKIFKAPEYGSGTKIKEYKYSKLTTYTFGIFDLVLVVLLVSLVYMSIQKGVGNTLNDWWIFVLLLIFTWWSILALYYLFLDKSGLIGIVLYNDKILYKIMGNQMNGYKYWSYIPLNKIERSEYSNGIISVELTDGKKITIGTAIPKTKKIQLVEDINKLVI